MGGDISLAGMRVLRTWWGMSGDEHADDSCESDSGLAP